jgi:hypothetical protein
MVRILQPGNRDPLPWWTRCAHICEVCGCMYVPDVGETVLEQGKAPNRQAESECPTCGAFVKTDELWANYLKPEVIAERV